MIMSTLGVRSTAIVFCLLLLGAFVAAGHAGVGTRCKNGSWETRPFQGVYHYNAWASALKGGAEGQRMTPGGLMMARCAVDGWHVARIGPMLPRGRGTKHVLGASGVVPAGMCVEASLLAPVNARGVILGAPPIVQHHVHVIQRTSIFEDEQARGYPIFDRNGNRFHYNPMWTDHRHGAQCDEARGGAGCLLCRYPAGYGQLYAEAANLDLALMETTAPLQEFWYELGFRECQSSATKLLAPAIWASPFHTRPCIATGGCHFNFTFEVSRGWHYH